MAKLEQLQIAGIRGFAPCSGDDQIQQINFSSPLTLILGQNGCGKTTIIEALNYACCGEILGSRKDFQDFVNDSKLSLEENLTKGNIKLQIQDGDGCKITVDRKVEVEVNQSSNVAKFKGKPTILTVVAPSGEISTSEGDYVKKLRQMIKLSPAVLNNVVFCHQENSNWPFSDGQKLKEKFDEIFEVEKYNKCVASLKEVYAEKESKIKVLKQQLAEAREKKQFLENQKRILQQKEDKLKLMEDEIQRLREQLEPVQKRFEEIHELKSTLDNSRQQLLVKEITKSRVTDEQETIRRGIPPEAEFQGRDEELEEEIKNFELGRQRNENTIKELEKERKEIDDESKLIDEELGETQIQLGELQEERNQCLKKCEERKSLIEKVKEEMGVKISSQCDSHEEATSSLQELKEALESWQNDLNVWIEGIQEEEARLQKSIENTKENKIRIENNVKFKEKQIEECQTKIAEISDLLTGVAIFEVQLKDYVSQIENIEGMIASLTEEFDECEEDKKLESYKTSIEKMERSFKSLEAELKILEQNEVIRRKLTQEESSMKEKMDEITKTIKKHYHSLVELFGEETPERNLKDAISLIQTEAESTVKNLSEEIEKKQHDIDSSRTSRCHQMDRISACEKELKEKQTQVTLICGDQKVENAIKTTIQKKDRLQKGKAFYDSLRVILNKYIKEFETTSPCCPICATDFSLRGELVKRIVANLKKKIDEIPQKQALVTEQLKKEDQRYEQLTQLQVVNDEAELLSSITLPRLREQLNRIDQSLETANRDLSFLESQLKSPQRTVDVCKSVIPDMAALDQNHADIEKSQQTITILKETLSQLVSNKTKADIEEELSFVKTKIAELTTAADVQAGKIKEYKDRKQLLTDERKGLMDEQTRLRENIQSKSLLESQKNELLKKIENSRAEISELKSKLASMEKELLNVIKMKEYSVQVNSLQVQEEKHKIGVRKNEVRDIENLQKEIEEYINKKTEEKLAAIEEKLKNCKTKQEFLEENKAKTIQQLMDKKQELAGQDLRFRMLEDNLILRNKMALEATLEKEIQVLKETLEQNDSKTIHEEERELSYQRRHLEKQIDTLTGEQTVVRNTVKELQQELDKSENKRAYSHYMSTYYQVKCIENIVYDLHKYIDALEQACLEFHQRKLTEVNNSLRDLWRNIYRGNDIDYIEIRSGFPTKGTKKQTCIYKIVKVKNGVEFEMKKRCSAGQKFLASLIVRLALADTLDCGILALDEPTASLDKESIENLSQVLDRIIQQRAGKKFQLLVITHNEEFASTLVRSQGIPLFYRVSRDKQGFSTIKEDTVL